MIFSGSMVALVTPMYSSGELDEESLASLIEWHVAARTDALVVAGTTGESPTLRRDEHARLVTRTVEIAGGRIPVIAGTGSNSTEQTLDMSRRAADAGVDGLMLVVPYYNKPPQRALVEHFRKVTRSVSLPIVLYNVPSRTVTDLLPETVAELSSEPGIVGLKDASNDLGRVMRLRALCGPEFALLSGEDATAATFMLAGGDGVISVTANVVPEKIRDLCIAARAGDTERAQQINEELRQLNEVLFIESNPIPVKWALGRMNRIRTGIRLPLVPLAADARPRVEKVLNSMGLVS